ncbi:ROK family protein, partial [Mycobacterium avium]
MLTLGLDIGGTKIAAALVDSSGTLVHTAVRPTPNPAPADDVWDVVHALIAEVVRAADAPIAAVG